MVKTMDKANLIIAAGSVDGILTTAAALRTVAKQDAELAFIPPATLSLDEINPDSWKSGRRVLFIGLTVNGGNEESITDFMRRLTEAGHEIVGICDGNDAVVWQRVLDAVGINVETLTVRPTATHSQTSAEALLNFLDEEIDSAHTLSLLMEGLLTYEEGSYSDQFAEMTARVIAATPDDQSRLKYIARHFAANSYADEQISSWATEAGN